MKIGKMAFAWMALLIYMGLVVGIIAAAARAGEGQQQFLLMLLIVALSIAVSFLFGFLIRGSSK